MKLVALCLLAVYCCALADAINRTDEQRKLHEVLRQLNDVRKTLQHSEKMLSTPPEDVEDCCCLSALECFRANMQVHFTVADKRQKILFKSLRNPLTLRSLDFCNSGNNNPTCHACDSHPKANVQEFFQRLETLINRAISRLTTD